MTTTQQEVLSGNDVSITLRGISKLYGSARKGRWALRDIDMTLVCLDAMVQAKRPCFRSLRRC